MHHDSIDSPAALRAANEALADELRRTHERYEALVRTDTQFVWGTDPSGLVVDMPEWRAFTGQSLEEVRGTGWATAVHPDDRAATAAAWAEAVAGRHIYDVEYRARHREGGYRWLHVRGVPVVEPDGTLREWIGVAQDVTAQKEAFAALERQHAATTAQMAQRTEELRQSEVRRERYWNLSLDLLDVVNSEGYLEEVNPAWTRLLGWSESELKAQPFLAYVHPDDVAPTLAEMARLDEGAKTLHFENRFRTKAGDYRHIDWTAQPEGGLFYAYGRDVTERKRDEEALKESHARLTAQAEALMRERNFARSIIENVPSGIAYLDRDLVYRVANPVYSAFLQMAPAEIVDRHLFDVVPGGEDQIGPLLKTVMETGKPHYAHEFPFTYRGPDGAMRETFWDFVYYPAVLTDGQDVDGVLVLADEVSERVERDRVQRELQSERDEAQRERIQALEQADKLKDEFLSILSHELRTPINAIMGFGSVLDDELAGPLTPAQHEYMGKVLASADILLALIDDLLVLSRVRAGKFTVEPTPTDLGAVIAGAVESLGPALAKKGLTASLMVEPGLPTVPADPQRLVQVVSNLVGNAIKFSPAGGAIAVSLERHGAGVRGAVTDHGIGIAPGDVGKLFRRFGQVDTSATRAHKGTGLGLSIVKAIIEAHGGTVGVESTPGAGSTFWFTLPADASR